MSSVVRESASREWTDLDFRQIKEVQELCEKASIVFTDCLILVNITTQRLHLAEKGKMYSYPISTAVNGVGQEEGSGKTPLGLHSVKEKIGEGVAPFAIFKSRIATGEIATSRCGGDAIVSRILWLDGLQPGFNQGEREGTVVDTYRRYIYIHGTNDLENIGKAVSSGCIRMLPDDVMDLFGRVNRRTLVHIYQA